MVDSAFSEWDKARMLMTLQQFETRIMNTAHKAGVPAIVLNANIALLLALIIIPTLSGVVLIA